MLDLRSLSASAAPTWKAKPCARCGHHDCCGYHHADPHTGQQTHGGREERTEDGYCQRAADLAGGVVGSACGAGKASLYSRSVPPTDRRAPLGKHASASTGLTLRQEVDSSPPKRRGAHHSVCVQPPNAAAGSPAAMDPDATAWGAWTNGAACSRSQVRAG